MGISDVKTYPLRAHLDEPFGFSQNWYHDRTGVLVQILTDEEIIGWGETYGPSKPVCTIIEDVLKPMIIGEDPFDVEVLWERMYHSTKPYGQKGIVIQAISAVDIALWDIMGKAAKKPIHKLFGGCFREKVIAYATGLYFKKTEELTKVLVEEALKYKNEGFRAVKMKIGLSPKKDLENVRSIREALGEDILLMVDANYAYNAHTAIKLGKKLEKYDIYWFEEPVSPEDINGYAKVREALNMAIAGGECEFTRFGFRNLLVKGAVDIVQPDISMAGGFTECKKIAEIANAWHVQCIPHVWGTEIGLAAALQFIASLPDCPPSLNPIPPMLEFDTTPHPFRSRVVTKPIRQKEGFVDIPKNPGLGTKIDIESIQKYSAR